MLEVSGFVAVPTISIICFFIAKIFKDFTDESLHKNIPTVVGLAGVVIATLAYLFIPETIPASNILEAITLGVISGLGSTGLHQVFKQAEKADENGYTK